MTDEEQRARAAIARTLAACTQAGDARKALSLATRRAEAANRRAGLTRAIKNGHIQGRAGYVGV